MRDQSPLSLPLLANSAKLWAYLWIENNSLDFGVELRGIRDWGRILVSRFHSDVMIHTRELSLSRGVSAGTNILLPYTLSFYNYQQPPSYVRRIHTSTTVS